jgi:hypothetical protein
MTHEHDAEAWDKHRAKHRPKAPAVRKRRATSRVRVWNTAIAIIDKSEPEVRDMIERGLVGVVALEHVRYHDAMKQVDNVVAQVAAIRERAIKKAFRLIRDGGGVDG